MRWAFERRGTEEAHTLRRAGSDAVPNLGFADEWRASSQKAIGPDSIFDVKWPHGQCGPDQGTH